MSFSSVPSTLKVSLLDISVGLLADHLVLLVVGGQEAADSAALSAGVSHELGILDTLSLTDPVLTPGVLINTALGDIVITDIIITDQCSPCCWSSRRSPGRPAA